ncbi:MAG TPA: glycosyltransferase 87 family protein [Candidatus Limnocylindria bacterium]
MNAAVQLRPSAAGALFTTLAVAAALVLLAMAVTGTGRGDALTGGSPTLAVAMRATFLFVSVTALVGLAWLRGIPYPPIHDPTPFHNDAIALNECAAQMLLGRADPYEEFGLLNCYGARGLGPDRTTPLRVGPFADIEIYPTEERMDAAWTAAARWSSQCLGCVISIVPPDFPFEWRLSYPALSFVLLVPWVVLGWDTNTLYVLCLLAAMALVVMRAPAGSRPFLITGLLAAVSLTAFTVGGSADLLYALPLVAAWLWRERRWSAVALGVAASVKQLAWPFAVFYLIQVATRDGWREATRRAAVAGAVFVAVNAPFVAWNAQAWIRGILTPVSEPMFPRGAGIVFLSTNGVLPLFPPTVYLALEGIAAVTVLIVAWRSRRTSPELGVVLAMVPLFFAWRSLFSYFFLLPLFAFAALARMPAGELSAETARASGALTVLAMPAPRSPAGRS